MSRPLGGSASYRAVLLLPHALGLFAAAMLARLSYGLLGLPLLLTLRQATGSYAVAGTAAGLFGLVSAVLGPARARLVERRPRTLMLFAVLYAGLLAVTAATGRTGAAPWFAITLAGVTGLFPPPVGPLMRALWGRLAADPRQRQRALSLDTVSESTVFAAGPALGGALIGAGSAPLALTVCAGLVLVGFPALARALRRAPARLRPTDRAAGTAGRAADPRPARGPLRRPEFAVMLLVVLGSACGLAVLEIASVASWGAGTAGTLLTLSSVGGAVGGLVYGKRSWRSWPGRRLAPLAVAGAVCFALPALLPAVPVAAVAFLGLGVCADLLLITAYLLVDALFPEGSQLEAGAWVNTCYNLGMSVGTGFAGALLDRSGATAVFTAAAAVAGLAAAAAVAGGRGCFRSPPPPGTDAASGVHDGDLAEADVLERSGN
ncbi:MFS transporter [Streptacidiphilus sp. N1-12]|uniref:MFS transporter n=2 Tax=Streptacidiphilus alkalitolerans TaxID=3342712 RepID=A0ABV6VKS0_9ACTN